MRVLDGRLGAALPDPIKTTNVQGLRCMTTSVVGKPGPPLNPRVASGDP